MSDEVETRAQQSNANIALFYSMLRIQNSVNELAGSRDWIYQTQIGKMDHATAAIDEMIEYRKSEPYEWWKKAERDASNMKMELVDAFHFFMSLTIANFCLTSKLSFDETLKVIATQFNANWSDAGLYSEGRPSWRAVVNSASSPSPTFAAGPFFRLCKENEIDTVPKLYRLYIGKAALNKFRKNHGYKEGTYLKLWKVGDLLWEDNAFLMKWLLSVPDNALLGEDDIVNWLEEQYSLQVNQ